MSEHEILDLGGNLGSGNLVVAALERQVSLAPGGERVVLAREARKLGEPARYFELVEFEDRVSGSAGWEWYRRKGDVDEFCARAEALSCTRTVWHSQWAWCEIRPSSPIDWVKMSADVERAHVWQLDVLRPEFSSFFIGAEWDPYGQPRTFRGLPQLWFTVLRRDDDEPFHISHLPHHKNGPFDEVMRNVAMAFPFSALP